MHTVLSLKIILLYLKSFVSKSCAVSLSLFLTPASGPMLYDPPPGVVMELEGQDLWGVESPHLNCVGGRNSTQMFSALAVH